MNRCVALAGLLLATLPVVAQAPRNFPVTALRGELAVATPPEITVDGQATRLAPGARIRGENNLMLVSGALAGGRWVVNYTRDGTGAVNEVWVLTTTEQANLPWPRTAAEAASWRFDAVAQRWTKP